MIYYSACAPKAKLWCSLQWAIVVLCIYCSTVVPLYSAVSTTEDEARSLVLNAYPNLEGQPLALVVLSFYNCTSCAATAINNMTSILRREMPSLACAVVVVGSDEVSTAELRDKFFTPYVVSDTIVDHAVYAAKNIADLPLLVVSNSKGNVVFRQENIQQYVPDYSAMIAKLGDEHGREEHSPSPQNNAALPSAKKNSLPPVVDEGGVVLEEPSTHPTKNLGTVVRAGTALVGLNVATGTLEVWHGETGAYLREITVPDTAQYFYRRQGDAELWQGIEEQGYEMARFEAIDARNDTVYALAKVLAHYTQELRVEKLASGVLDSSYSIDWQPGQVVVRMVEWKVDRIIPVPSEYPLFDIVINTAGDIAGACANALVPAANPGDSSAFFVLFHKRNSSKHVGATAWNTHSPNGMVSVGGKAAAPNGVWYCDPSGLGLVLLHPDGSRSDILMRGVLSESASPVALLPSFSDTASAYESQPAYMLDNLASVGDTLHVFLTPIKSLLGLPCVVQSYTTAGQFLGEWTLNIPFAQGASWIHLLAVENGQAVLLLDTSEQRWRVVRTPFAPPVVTRMVPVSRREQKNTSTR